MTFQVPQYAQDKGYPARLDRQVIGDIFTAGVRGFGDLTVSTSGAARTISIAAGAGYVPGTQSTGQGTYRAYNDAAVTLQHDAAVTFPRLDQIVIRLRDNAEDASTTGATPEIVKGVETNGATVANRNGAVADGAMPANTLRLADVLVPVGANPVIPSGNIGDRRVIASSLVGAPIGTIVACCILGDPLAGIWVAADGRLVDKTLYGLFYTGVGHAYNGGVDPGSNKVRIPDKRGRFLVAVNDMGTAQGAITGADRLTVSRGGSGGETAHTLTTGEIPSHGHDLSGADALASGSGPLRTPHFDTGQTPDWTIGAGGVLGTAIANAGGGGSHTNLPPYEADSMIVRIA